MRAPLALVAVTLAYWAELIEGWKGENSCKRLLTCSYGPMKAKT